MQTIYDGAHSIMFSDLNELHTPIKKDTWKDWKLVPSSMPVVPMPEVNINTIEVPGMNGILDLSEIPLGFPTYKQRTGSWDFKIAHDATDLSWAEACSEIAAYLHGKRLKCILTDDRSYYYTGRFQLSDIKSDRMCNSITIDYELNPFKEMIWTTCENWMWDPFDFVHGVIDQSNFKDIVVIPNDPNQREWTQDHIGCAPVTPTFTVHSTGGTGMNLIYANSVQGLDSSHSFHLDEGVNYNPQIEFVCPSPGDQVAIAIFGEGTISIDFRPGRL